MEKADWLAADLVTGWWFYQRSNDEEEEEEKKIGIVSGELALSGCIYRQSTHIKYHHYHIHFQLKVTYN